MKILQVTSHLDIGGISRYVLSLSTHLVRRGHKVIIASDNGKLKEQAVQNQIVHWRLPLSTSAEFSPKVLWGIHRLARQLEQEKVDIIHAHTRVAQVVADRVSKRFQIPYVTTWHGVYTPRLGRRLWPCTGERTIAISGLVHQHLIRDFHIPQDQIHKIHNGIDVTYYSTKPDASLIQEYRKRWGIPDQKPVIGGIGRLARGGVKGFDLLLSSVHLLRQLVPELQVLIVGEGPRRSFLEVMARRLGISDRVHFIGLVDDIRIPLAMMDIFIFTSRWPEAFGLTVVEAMAAGKMVIATEVGAVPEIIRHCVDGWTVPPDDPAVLAECIVRFLTDRKMAQEFGRQAQTRVSEAFSLDRMVTQVEGVYQELLRSPFLA